MLISAKNIIMLSIITFLVMSFWSLISMPMDINGKMVNCPFMDDSASICQMTVFEHVSAWQRFFTVLREKNLLLSLFFLLIILFVSLFAIKQQKNKIQYQRLRNYLYRYKPEIKLFDRL